jgi:hypothetical protein
MTAFIICHQRQLPQINLGSNSSPSVVLRCSLSSIVVIDRGQAIVCCPRSKTSNQGRKLPFQRRRGEQTAVTPIISALKKSANIQNANGTVVALWSGVKRAELMSSKRFLKWENQPGGSNLELDLTAACNSDARAWFSRKLIRSAAPHENVIAGRRKGHGGRIRLVITASVRGSRRLGNGAHWTARLASRP